MTRGGAIPAPEWWTTWCEPFDPPPAGALPSLAGGDLTPALARFLEVAFGLTPAEAVGPQLGPAAWPALRGVGTGVAADALLAAGDLRRLHARAMGSRREGSGRPAAADELSLLELKRQLAHHLTSPCRTCSYRCRARRAEGQTGRCRAGRVEEARVGNLQVLVGEEPFLSSTIEVGLSGCPEACTGCLYRPAISPRFGRPFQPADLAVGLRTLATAEGARSLMLLGGSPEVHLARWLDLLVAGAPELPVVWNTAGLMTPETLEVLDGVVGAYLIDLKFRTSWCAEQNLAPGLALARIARAVRGAAGQGVPCVLRLLVRPGHTLCCAVPLVRYAGRLARQYPNVYLHPMLDWLPVYDAARHPRQRRPLSAAERAQVEAALARDSVLTSRRLDARLEAER